MSHKWKCIRLGPLVYCYRKREQPVWPEVDLQPLVAALYKEIEPPLLRVVVILDRWSRRITRQKPAE